MKKSIVIMLALLLLLTAGCSNTKGKTVSVDSQKNDRRTDAGNRPQMEIKPEMALAMTISGISRLERSQSPLTKDQANKLLVILKEVQDKEQVDKEYADKKSEEIKAVLTDEQKQMLTQRRGRNGNNSGGNGDGNNGGNNGDRANGGNPPPDGGNLQPPPDGGGKLPPDGGNPPRDRGNPPPDGGNPPANGERRGRNMNFNLKDICERTIMNLEDKVE